MLTPQSCSLAGVPVFFNAPNTLACLAQLFEEHDALDRLEAFTSLYGPKFYRLPVNTDMLTLVRHDAPQPIMAPVTTEDGLVTVFDPQIDIFWSVADSYEARRAD